MSLNGSSHRTGKERAGPHSSIGCHKRYRRGPYLNNLTQRGHLASKPRTYLMLGFGRFMAPARLCSTFDAVDHRRRRPTRLGTCVAHFRLFMRERSDERMADRSETLRSGHWIRRGAHGRCVHPHPAAYTGGWSPLRHPHRKLEPGRVARAILPSWSQTAELECLRARAAERQPPHMTLQK